MPRYNEGSVGQDHFAITPSDTVDQQFHGLWVGTAGHVAIVSVNGTALVYKNVANGTPIPMSGKRVNLTGTTATDIIGILC